MFDNFKPDPQSPLKLKHVNLEGVDYIDFGDGWIIEVEEIEEFFQKIK